MAETQTVKHYGKAVKINGEFEGDHTILSSETITPQYADTDITVGDKIVHRRETLKTVDYAADATALEGTTPEQIIADVNARVPALIAALGIAPTGGSLQVKLGEIDVTPESAMTVKISASYLPHAPATPTA